MADAATGSEETLGAAASPPLPPDALIIVPVRGLVLFPGTVLFCSGSSTSNIAEAGSP